MLYGVAGPLGLSYCDEMSPVEKPLVHRTAKSIICVCLSGILSLLSGRLDVCHSTADPRLHSVRDRKVESNQLVHSWPDCSRHRGRNADRHRHMGGRLAALVEWHFDHCLRLSVFYYVYLRAHTRIKLFDAISVRARTALSLGAADVWRFRSISNHFAVLSRRHQCAITFNSSIDSCRPSSKQLARCSRFQVILLTGYGQCCCLSSVRCQSDIPT